jgi:hypothetical protein
MIFYVSAIMSAQGRPLNSNVEARCFIEKIGGNVNVLEMGVIFLYFKSTVPAIP